MRPNFKNIDIKNAGFAATNAAEWAKTNGIEPVSYTHLTLPTN